MVNLAASWSYFNYKMEEVKKRLANYKANQEWKVILI